MSGQIRSRNEIRKRIELLRASREGSLVSREFEAGELFALLWVLEEEPRFETREQAQAFIAAFG